jgi:hypothetical protein
LKEEKGDKDLIFNLKVYINFVYGMLNSDHSVLKCSEPAKSVISRVIGNTINGLMMEKGFILMDTDRIISENPINLNFSRYTERVCDFGYFMDSKNYVIQDKVFGKKIKKVF